MLDITFRVTKTSVHLEQIIHVGVVNRGRDNKNPALHRYGVYHDGVYYGEVVHDRDQGALALGMIVMNHLVEQGAGD